MAVLRPFACGGVRKATRAACLLLLLLGATRSARADAWEDRLRAEIVELEKDVDALDGKRAASGDLIARTKSLDQRIASLEKAKDIPVGSETIVEEGGNRTLMSLSTAVVSLRKRVRRLKGGEGDQPRAPRGDEPEPEPEPEDRAGWPESLQFSASASLTYEATGSYYREYSQYLQSGWTGRFALSLRTRGLEREIKEVGVAFVITPTRVFEPFVHRVVWRARRRMWNSAKKTWPAVGTGQVSVPYRWISKEAFNKTHRMKCSVEAHVYYVIDKDGKRIEFQFPERFQRIIEESR